jgi:hypothetical protein
LKSGTSALAFAQPKLELAKSVLKPGADFEAGISEVQSLLRLKNGDPRIAALRQQGLSMVVSGHAPSEVVAKQKDLATKGMNADQVLTQTPGDVCTFQKRAGLDHGFVRTDKIQSGRTEWLHQYR